VPPQPAHDAPKGALQELLARPPAERRLGPYVLRTMLGKGGFAPVWLADETYGDVVLRRVALKIFQVPTGLTPLPGQTERSRAAVIEEARALCQVEHPNVVRFYAMPTDDALGLVGLAMELVEGRSLDHAIAGDGGAPRGLSIPEALAVGGAIASALSVVHAAGLVHRDVKPANVIDAGGTYKLIDFGIAAAEVRRRDPRQAKPARSMVLGDVPIDDAGSFLAVASSHAESGPITIGGTPGYVDPACLAEGTQADAASDLYSLGATLYEALSGWVPAVADARAHGETGLDPEVLHGLARPPSIAKLCPEVPARLAELVDALLSPKREARPRSAEAVARTLARVQVELRGHARARPPEEIGPFRGLARFEEGDAEVFFGRVGDVASALELLRARGLIAVIGASGSGKSSLVRAGVVPAWIDGQHERERRDGKSRTWRASIVAPGREPFEALRAALAEQVPAVAALAEPSTMVDALATLSSTERGVLLVVDPLEELATLAEGPSRARAIELLSLLGARPIPWVRTIVALRRDMLDPILALDAARGEGSLGALVLRGGTLFVDALREEAWGEVIDAGLAAYGHRFEDDAMRAEILAELRGAASAMPLVQFALAELWARRDTDRKLLTRAALREIGGVVGALRRHAESTVSRLVSTGHGLAEIRALLLAMTTPLGTRATCTRKELSALLGVAETSTSLGTLDALVAARLLVEDASGLTLAHESLLSSWPRLREWVEEAREDRVLLAALDAAAEEWSAAGDPTLLWRGKRLDRARALRRARVSRPSERGARFLAESERARRRQYAGWAAGAGAIALVLLVIGGLWLRQLRAPRQCVTGDLADCTRQCDRGHLGSCSSLGQMLEAGLGVARDEERALDVYRRACEGGHGLSCFSLGRMIDEEKGGAADPAQVFLLFRKACDLGDPQGCHGVAVKLSDLEQQAEVAGDLDKRDARRKEIADLFRRGCDGGFARACTSLAIMMDQGELGADGRAKADALYERACAKGEPAACALKGGLGRTGQLDRADPTLLRRACLAGYGYGCNVLGIVLEGKGSIEGPGSASVAYQRGCNVKEGDACANLGRLFESGGLAHGDALRAYTLYARGCELGSATACRARARMQASGVPADRAAARRILRSQCDRMGDLDACVAYAALGAEESRTAGSGSASAGPSGSGSAAASGSGSAVPSGVSAPVPVAANPPAKPTSAPMPAPTTTAKPISAPPNVKRDPLEE
jgi:serine/threonine protein kinase/TPR repeat protein